MHVIYTGAHGGFDTSRIPLGGGATVMDALAREWSRTQPYELTILGVGDRYDLPNVRYVKLPVPIQKPLTDLSEMEYARFCRAFERATTEWIRSHAARSRETVVLSNDISEGPNFGEVATMGLPVVTIFHVDVVEYVAKFYCRGLVKPEFLTRLHRGLETLRMARCVPDVVRLIFEKQADCVRHSATLIVPSSGMGHVLKRCYPGCGRKIEVIPWGAIDENCLPDISNLKSEFDISEDESILLTLCRISPEKGIERLLEALIHWEGKVGSVSAPRICCFICGAPAYMQGQAYLAKLQRIGARLKNIRVHFVGHVSGERKRAFFEVADLYVHLSHHESYGLTIAEAMRAGCAVLTSDHHSARDLVPSECGRIVSGRKDETVAALRDLLGDRARLQTMGAAAVRHAETLQFSSAAAKVAEVLQKLAPVPVAL